jgi:hypothetical protein
MQQTDDLCDTAILPARRIAEPVLLDARNTVIRQRVQVDAMQAVLVSSCI